MSGKVDSTFPSDIAENQGIESEVRFNLIGLRSGLPPAVAKWRWQTRPIEAPP
jgi:hypothetical protein